MSTQLFPGYETALDTESLIPQVEECLAKDYKNIEITDCKISEVKFYPSRYGTVLYKVQMYDRFFRQRWSHYLTAQLLPEGVQPSYACPPFLLKEKENLSFFLFPNDPVMEWLPQAYNQEIMTQQFRKYWFPKHQKARKMEINLLSYTPQMRAAFEYHILLEDRTTKEAEWVTWIGKSNNFKKSHRIHARHYSVWKALGGKIGIPEPMGFTKNPQVAFQEKVPGERLGNLINSPNIGEILEAVAESIARFHQMRVPLANIRTEKTEIGTLNRWCTVLKNVSEELKPRIETIEKQFSSEIEKRIQFRAPIHADFHQTNVLVDGKQPYLIDFDEMAIGDPSVDLGRFLASLRTPMQRVIGHINGMDAERDRFLEVYQKHCPIDIRDVRLFEAASLVTSAASAYRLQRPNWKEEVPVLIEEAERMFAQSKRSEMVSIPDVPALTYEERCAWAQDEEFLLALLSPHVEGDPTECCVEKVWEEEKALWLTVRVTYWEGHEKKKKQLLLQLPEAEEARKIYEKNKRAEGCVYLAEVGGICENL